MSDAAAAPSSRASRRKRQREATLESGPAPIQPTPPWKFRLHLLGASLLLILLASHRFTTVLSEPGGRFEDPDAAFHARRAARTISEGTLLPPVFDAFENFPTGGRAVWPPLHDATLALLARVGGSSKADPARGLGLAAGFPVLELVLAMLCATLLARRFAGDQGGILAAWLFATTPALIRRGAFGEIDHNMTEVLGGLLLSLLACHLVETREGSRTRFAAPLLWAGAVLLALGFYAGLALSAALVAAGVLVAEFFKDRSIPRRGSLLAAGFALSALVLPLVSSIRVTPDPGDPWRLGPVYVLILAATAIVCGALALASSPDRTGKFFAIGSVITGAFLSILAPAAARAGFAKGIGFLGSRDRWLATIDEFRPLITSPAGLLASLPAVLAGVFFAGIWLSRRRENPDTLSLLVPFISLLTLALLQKRFLPPAAAFGAAAAGACWELRDRRRWLGRAVVAIGIFAVASSLFAFLRGTARAEADPNVTADEAAAAMLTQLTPQAETPPKWGVLAPWEYGHQILRRSGRPVALNNFGSFHPGFEKALAIFNDSSPSHAVRTLDELRLRYIVAVYPPNVSPHAAAILGIDPARFWTDGFSPDRLTRYIPTAEGEKTLLVRLHLHDGMGAPLPGDTDSDRLALLRFKKIGESQEEGPGPDGRPVPFMKLFELLP